MYILLVWKEPFSFLIALFFLVLPLRQFFFPSYYFFSEGYVKLEFLLSALKYGATTCVFKPLNDLSELEEAVNAAVRHLQRWQKKFKELRGLQA